jgi:sRNA-binding carbon storage regulator CsrA
MGYYRQMRKRDELHIDGPDGTVTIIRVESGRPGITVEAPKQTKIDYRKRRKRLAGLPRKP